MTDHAPDVARTARLAIPEPVLEQLEAHGLPVTGVLDQVEHKLHDQVRSSHAFVDEVARYLIQAGGKRFRPLLVALTGHLGDPTRPELVDAGVIVELVHLATLYHDDVIDEAAARRGAPSANSRWDNTVAILTGDYLFARASDLSADLGVEVTRIMSRTLAALCEGQIREVQGSMSTQLPDVPTVAPTLEHYLEVVSGKTASLIATACRYGAMLSGVDADGVEATARYGWNVGMAFQLSDDVLDVASDHEQSGKTPGTDLREGVRTLPVLFALEDDADGELAALLDGELADAEVDRALALLRGSDVLDRSRAAAGTYVDAAVAELDRFGDRPIVAALTRLATYALDRAG
ncbi:polyprenyl synthetase family protein [Nitriliruptoraceae bacterium ZYF776]|nr:polyprenyl synthetase family protein [Profundirhabdus halotolerans]